MNALTVVRKFFPQVREVVDANRPTVIEVTARDANPRAAKDHEACALAVACKRSFKLDGVIIARSTAYLVKGRKARRFQLPPATSREIVSFDRGGGFQPGVYLLSAVTKAKRLGERQGSDSDKKTGNGKSKQFRHLTSNVRAVLGGGKPVGE